MRIVVFGAGGVGSLLGGLLSTRHEVTLIGRREHVRAVEGDGLRLRGTVEGVFRPTAREDVYGLGSQDVVLITVKAYDTDAAVREVTPLVAGHTLVVSVQNGLGNAEKLVRAYGSRALIGVPVLGANCLAPGEVQVSGLREVMIGSTVGQHGHSMRLGSLLTECGVPAHISANIMSEVWAKAVINAAVNPITALVGKENGALLRDDGLRQLSRAACAEGAKAAEANGITLGDGDFFDRVQEVIRTTAGNRSSMLQDIERGKRTEIEEINGALVRAGESKGLEMPVNRALWALVRGRR
ncbi:MAG: 2-dehydropantoate 2-reductase [Methanomassiliicoccus sp.]|nr:2-dehydropantoate 2-reductase [Methanomassiliicoccus sp.]